ncbi:hypothetical protein MKK84_18735 [Methylobacterium sp. E-065]|uniref:hypothetical protein n=1 Tax=Methylobacterium sp. E-065 TaxID=2836583 RepID=UPI001FBA1271|nr:hypothetical protein [Methylobacterium sp. E-065]MCJ2019448.1 hypothetical protein [Methylobacterium sp. E-065]
MGRPASRRTPPSGAVLLWDRRHREATRALAAQVPGAVAAPLSGAGEGGAQSVIGMSISEQRQQVRVVTDVRVARTEWDAAGGQA